MSDLAATNCGCECGGNNTSWNMSGNNWIWIILLLSCCGGSSCGFSARDNGGCGCDSIWLILFLLCCCGNNNGGCF